MRKKKFQEHILSKTDGHLENLERMVHDLEFAQVEVKVIDGLKVGNASLKKLHDLLSIDDIEKVLDETREGIEKQQEIDEMLSGELTDNDESEAEAELDALLAADVEEKAAKVREDVTLPDVPQDVTLPEVPEGLPEKKKRNVFKLFSFIYLLLRQISLLKILNWSCFFIVAERTKDKTAEPVALEA